MFHVGRGEQEESNIVSRATAPAGKKRSSREIRPDASGCCPRMYDCSGASRSHTRMWLPSPTSSAPPVTITLLPGTDSIQRIPCVCEGVRPVSAHGERERCLWDSRCTCRFVVELVCACACVCRGGCACACVCMCGCMWVGMGVFACVWCVRVVRACVCACVGGCALRVCTCVCMCVCVGGGEGVCMCVHAWEAVLGAWHTRKGGCSWVPTEVLWWREGSRTSTPSCFGLISGKPPRYVVT